MNKTLCGIAFIFFAFQWLLDMVAMWGNPDGISVPPGAVTNIGLMLISLAVATGQEDKPHG